MQKVICDEGKSIREELVLKVYLLLITGRNKYTAYPVLILNLTVTTLLFQCRLEISRVFVNGKCSRVKIRLRFLT